MVNEHDSGRTDTEANRPVFIVGADRSGTTLLRLIVNAHPELSSPAETWFLVDLMRMFPTEQPLTDAQVEQAISHVTSLRRWKNFNVSAEDLRRALLGTSPTIAQFFATFMELEIGGNGAMRWVDKTPEYVFHIHKLATIYPTAKFLHISRDGRDVFRSLQPKRWRGRTALRIGQYWARCIDHAMRAQRNLTSDQWMWIRYEDLVQDTAGTAKSICAHVGVDFDPAMVDFHETAADLITEGARRRGIHDKLLRAPSEEDVYKWQQRNPELQDLFFESLARWQLEAAGYEPRLSPLRARLLKPLAYLDHFVRSSWTKLRNAVGRPQPKERPGA